MVNVFSSYLSPERSAAALDNKRIGRMCYESADILSSAVLKNSLKYPELVPLTKYLYRPPTMHYRHGVADWAANSLSAFAWLNRHMRALNAEYKHRYDKDDYSSYTKVKKAVSKAQHFLRSRQNDDTRRTPLRQQPVILGEFFNYNEFRRVYSARHRGRGVVLNDSIDTTTRYRLSLLHKYLYLDARVCAWTNSSRGVPLYCFYPPYREWLNKHFGAPVRVSPDLVLQGDAHYDALDRAHSENRALLNLRSIGHRLLPPKQSLIQCAVANTVYSTAVFDPTETYRYYLSRQWDHNPPLIALMCNPSTANAFKNDPTVAIIEKVARAEGFGGYVILNLSPYRATDPSELYHTTEHRFSDNRAVIESTLQQIKTRWRVSPEVLCAYGAESVRMSRLDIDVADLLNLCTRHGLTYALAFTKQGIPRHPLYLPHPLSLNPYDYDLRQ